MAIGYESELEWELEDEFTHEFEDESIHEVTNEFEDEFEDEQEWGDILGGIAKGIGGLLGEGEDEFSHEFSHEYESEEFLGSVGRFFKKNAPLLKKIAKVAAPLVGTAIGGPAVGALVGKATSLLESEFEDELEFGSHEFGSHEYHELGSHEIHEIGMHEALAEMMAESALHSETEAEAEALMGAAVATTISPADRRILLQALPYITRGTAVLTRILRRNTAVAPVMRVVPFVARSTAKTLAKTAAAGRPITPKTIARVMTTHTNKVLSSPRLCTGAVVRNVRAAQKAKRSVSRRTRPAARRPAVRG